MRMNLEELDDITRKYMLEAFEAEEASDKPYRSKALSKAGLDAFAEIMRDAIRVGTEETMMVALAQPAYWNPTETYVRKGVTRERQVNVSQASERLAITEFNTWYVRGLSIRLMEEGVEYCQAYRAAQPKWEPGECAEHEGQLFRVRDIHNGHRVRYWPEPGNPTAISIPFGPGCHHTIRRA